MKILAFDTALAACAAGFYDTETGQSFAETLPMARGQSEALMPLLVEIMAKAGLGFSALDLIATTVGPGAFTGVRIGLSAARALGLALDIPVDGVLTTEAIAAKFYRENKTLNGNLLVILETKREDFYVHAFSSNNKQINDVSALTHDVITTRYGTQEMTVCGDGLPRLRTTLGPAWPARWNPVDGFTLTDPITLATLASARRESGKPRAPDPVYLRNADVSHPARPGRIIAGKTG